MTPMQKYIKSLQNDYYNGTPSVSNEEYDALVARFGEDSVGGEGGRFKHVFRMYSLDKVYPNRGDVYPLPLSECVRSPKLDGCAVALLYVLGNLQQGNTRGDGISTPTSFEPWKMEALGIPKELSASTLMQVTGEVVTTKRVENERNFASGAMQLQDEAEFRSRVNEGGLIFVAYNVQESSDKSGVFPSYLQDMRYLGGEGFNTCLDSDWDECPQDGIVYRLDSNKAHFDAGFTEKFPKGAFAEKEDEAAIETTLTDVLWQVGKSGKVTPVAIFDPITIDDAVITRATLNNVGYIEALELEIGDTVQVIRSGGIIPKIVGKV
ncbi:DNA ligase, phage-associated [Vibrio phage VCPH]|nr:DNA ligase, phage-associated [Vibrio phage VCPH]